MEIYTNRVISFELQCNNLGKKEVIKAIKYFLDNKTTWSYENLKIKDKLELNEYDFMELNSLVELLEREQYSLSAKELKRIIRKIKRVCE